MNLWKVGSSYRKWLLEVSLEAALPVLSLLPAPPRCEQVPTATTGTTPATMPFPLRWNAPPNREQK